MYIPLIQSVQSSELPWQVYRRLSADSEVSFFLDSGEPPLAEPSFSLLAASPFLEAELRDGKFIISGEENAVYPESDAFKVLREYLAKYKTEYHDEIPFPPGGIFGFLGYEFISRIEKIQLRDKLKSESPALYFGFFKDLIVYEHAKRTYHFVSLYDEAGGTSEKSAAGNRNEYLKERLKGTTVQSAEFALNVFKAEISKKDFMLKVDQIKEYIRAGDVYQANLSQKFSVEYEGTAEALYEKLRKINPSPFASFFKLRDLVIVSNSPERLVQRRGSSCETRPIAGTRPSKHSSQAMDETQKDLLDNEKERAEHIMLVDLERNDLGKVCDYETVCVEEMMSVERYSHVMHIVSRISGQLQQGKDSLDLLRAMFPGGTITGCPKIRCMQIIDELEPSERGIYTGSIGYIGFDERMDFNIVIRTLLLSRGRGEFRVGAGIVYDSDPEKEYFETLHKGEALTEAMTVSLPTV